MARAVPLFSGSKGNSYYIGSASEGVLIDAGRSCKQIENAMLANGLDMGSIGAIFITHEHTDHCSALRVLAKRYGFKVYSSLGTLNALRAGNKLDPNTDADVITDEVVIGNMRVQRIDTPPRCGGKLLLPCYCSRRKIRTYSNRYGRYVARCQNCRRAERLCCA